MVFGSTVTNAIFGPQLILKKRLVVVFIPVFDRRGCREGEKHAVLKTEFRIVLNDRLIFRQFADVVKLGTLIENVNFCDCIQVMARADAKTISRRVPTVVLSGLRSRLRRT